MNIADAATRAFHIWPGRQLYLGGRPGELFVQDATPGADWKELASGKTWSEVILTAENSGKPYTEADMPVYVGKPEGKEFPPAPEGLHQAVCVDVIDRGIVKGTWGERPEVDLIFQVVPFDDDGAEMRDEEGNRFQLLARYRASLHEKSNLYKHLVAWRGKAFTEDEIKKFDLELLLGANCQIQVAHNLGSNGRTYGNIQAIVPLGKKTTKIAPENFTRNKDRKPGNGASPAHQDPDEDLAF